MGHWSRERVGRYPEGLKPEVTDGQAEGLQQASGFACAPLFIGSLRADVDVNGAILRNNNRYKAAWFCKVK